MLNEPYYVVAIEVIEVWLCGVSAWALFWLRSLASDGIVP
jgi:hypothetical protein